MILYHYQISPYSEMIRVMLGFSQQSWASHRVSPYPPRKTVDELTGGYRRIPVAQIGADVFCDTKIIAEEIAELSGNDSLSFQNLGKSDQEFVQHTHNNVFMAVAQTGEPKKALAMVLRNHWPWDLVRLLKDRGAMLKKSNLKRRTRREMLEEVSQWVSLMESRLKGNFLSGNQPCLADFAAYHVLWFARATRSKDPAADSKKVQQWYYRMQSFGQGDYKTLSQRECWQQAREASPRTLLQSTVEHELLNSKVVIGPKDYGLDSVSGVLLAVTDDRFIIARESKECGLLHVHFPVEGYALRAVD